jgi:hypothetical protein
MRLSAARARRRPFDPAKQTNASGGWVWVDLPQSVLLNNRGIAADCALGAYGNAQPISCAPAAQWVPPGRSAAQPWASPSNKGAARAAAACCTDALARAGCQLPGQNCRGDVLQRTGGCTRAPSQALVEPCRQAGCCHPQQHAGGRSGRAERAAGRAGGEGGGAGARGGSRGAWPRRRVHAGECDCGGGQDVPAARHQRRLAYLPGAPRPHRRAAPPGTPPAAAGSPHPLRQSAATPAVPHGSVFGFRQAREPRR